MQRTLPRFGIGWLWKAAGARLPTLLVGAFLLIFASIAEEMAEGDTSAFDQKILLLLRSSVHPGHPVGPRWLEEAARDITALGSTSVLFLIVLGVVLAMLLMSRRRIAIYVVVAVLSGTGISNALKALFNRPRPHLADTIAIFTPSFPSGHATVSAVAYLTLGACLTLTTSNRRLQIFYLSYAIVLAILIGLSRIYLGVHFPTDVLAGWALGAGWALCCWAIAQPMFNRSRCVPTKI